MMPDASALADMAKIGAELTAKGFKSFSKWAKEMEKIYGEEISPHMLKLWDMSKEIRQEVKESENSENYNQHKREVSKTKTINGDESEKKIFNTVSKLTFKGKILDAIYFVGGAFICMISLTGGYYNLSGSGFIGYSSGSGFRLWSVIGMAVGICMIVFGFLRRSWAKKGQNSS